MNDSQGLVIEPVPFAEGPSSEILLPPEFRHLGAADRAVPGKGSLEIGDEVAIGVARPFVIRLAHLYDQGHGHEPDPAEFRIYHEYDLWLILHAVGAIRRAGGVRLRRLGYVAEFGKREDDDAYEEDRPDRALATCGLVPEPRSLDRLKVEATLGAEGTFDLPGEGVKAGWLDKILSLVPGVGMKLNSSIKVTGDVRFGMQAPVISAVGMGRPLAEWAFDNSEGELYGDHVMVSTLRVPRGLDDSIPPVPVKVRAYAQVAEWYEWTSCPRLVWTDPQFFECAPATRPPSA